VDVLEDLLSRSDARGAVFAVTTVHGEDWSLRFDDAMRFGVHVILDGSALVRHDDGSSVWARAGDVVAVRTRDQQGRPLGHSLAGSDRPARAVRLSDFLAQPGVHRGERRFVADGPGRATTFACGALRLDGDLFAPLLDTLPAVLVVPAAPGSSLRAAVDALVLELADERPGQQTMLDRLLDVVFICILRDQLAREPRQPGWHAAMSDPALARALSAIHADPAREHTVASLADAARLSRAAFAQRFTAAVGMPPHTYLTRWRMSLARERLRDTDDPLAAIAREVGYGSPYAFGAAFKRTFGTAPGTWRARETAVQVGA
jgi:AraC-like DNA-binding protein